jgi:hypothetical protein
MALDGTITTVSSQDVGDGELKVLDIQGPSSYTIGGELLGRDLTRLRVGARIDLAEGKALDPANGYAKWDEATATLKFYTAADVEQGAIDLSADVYRVALQGR